MKLKKSPFISLIIIIILAIIVRLIAEGYLDSNSVMIAWAAIIAVLGLGVYLVKKTADIIEETTEILKEKTGLAGGMLQALGTALPDMIIGITAALMSLSVAKSDPALSFSYALIATAATFGSNIYNIGFAAWCVHRQNVACKKKKDQKMFFIFGGTVHPMDEHSNKPYIFEVTTSIRMLSALSFLTTFIVLAMVLLGQVSVPYLSGNVYQLKSWMGLFVLAIAVLILYSFRKDYSAAKTAESNPFSRYHQAVSWLFLFVSGICVFAGAEAMVQAINRLSGLANIPVILAGVLAGVIGCLGEMIVIYKFTINPKGRIGDAVVGIAMDNTVTIIGASIVAALGGIFLGSNALIIIFVMILLLNTILMWQVSELKDEYVSKKHLTAHLKKE